MNEEKVSGLINQIENILIQLKNELGLKIDARIKKIKKRKTVKKKTNLETPISALISDGFFSDWRKDIDVCQKLKEKILTPRSLRRSSVTNVLRRFFNKDLLERKLITENKKRLLVYRKSKK